jgi:UDP:flavonoid glycosyltransferase YjiC (YdhE family)
VLHSLLLGLSWTRRRSLDLIWHSALTISHGGLNTALESLACGVPIVVLPVTYDQPGVGARVECAGVGRSIPIARLTLERLRVAVRTVLDDPAYRVRAGLLRSSIEAADGLNRAADLIESAFGARRRDDVRPDLSPEGDSTASASRRVAAKV